MSCPPELTFALYVDAVLEGEALHDAESHLVGCRSCRALVVALRDENSLLTDVLQERHREAPAPAQVPTPEPGMALGAPVAIAAATVVLATIGFLLDARLPGVLDLLHPRRLKGVAEMGFDLVFLLRENAPGLVELGFSVGVVASVSALLSFAVSTLSRRFFGGTALLLLALALSAQPASAFDLRLDQDTRIAKGERVSESLVLNGDRVDIDGVVDGDLIVAAEKVTIRGEVTGSLYVFTRDLSISGAVGGSLVGATEIARIDGKIGGSLFYAGDAFTLTPDGSIGDDANLFVEMADLEGKIARDAFVVGNRVEVRGEVGRHVESMWVEELALGDDAHVKGDIDVKLPSGHEIEQSSGARVDGEIRTAVATRPHESYLGAYTHPRFYLFHLLGFAAAFVFGLLLYAVAPRALRGAMVTTGDFFRTLGMGFVVIVVTPIAVIATALTIVGIPIAVVTLFAYIVALYTAELAVGAWLGRLLWSPEDDSTLAFGKSFGIGLGILIVVTHAPFLGPPATFVTLMIGMGMLAVQAREAIDWA